MRDDSTLEESTRRAVLRGLSATLGVGAVGPASAHEKFDDHDDESESGPAGENDPTHPAEGTRDELDGVEFVGYHALGGTGRPETGSAGENADERFGDNPKGYQSEYGAEAMDPHYGAVTEIRVHGDYAYVTYFSAEDPTPTRGLAIVDVSEYNAAETDAEVEAAELEVVGFLSKNNVQAAAMDVKVSDDGQYAFVSTQPYTFLFGGIAGNTDDPTHAEGMVPRPNVEDSGFTYTPSGVVAVDVSDKENPRTLDSFTLEGSGSHNAYHHRIDGEDYVFAINDSGNLAGTGSGMFVIRFDRGSGRLELVNRWYLETNLAQGEVTTEDTPLDEPYIHDMEIQNDPRTGTPVCYLAYWDRGMWALDVSDPTDIEPLGNFQMEACHFASPAPTTVNGKRLAVASQEVSESDVQTGRVYLVDCDGLFESDDRYHDVPRTVDEVALLGELDVWYWANEHEHPGADAVEFGPYDFSLSPHNSDFTTDANGDLWIHQSHYGGGVRFLRVDPGTDNGLVSARERFACNTEDDCAPVVVSTDEAGNEQRRVLTGVDAPHNDTDWTISEEGWARPNLEPPKESRMEGLNYLTPFCWGANESNGVTFAADINQGVYALRQVGGQGSAAIPVGGAPPVADLTREDDGSVYLAGRYDHVELTLEELSYHETATLRERVPDGWEIYDGDHDRTVEVAGETYLVFEDVSEGETVDYIAQVGSDLGSYQLGPVQASADGGETWLTLPDSTDSNFVVGSTGALALGSGALGTAGVVAGGRLSEDPEVDD